MPTQIIVVDDDKVCRSVLSRHLRGFGYLVHESAGFAEALEQACVSRASLMLLDFWLPEGDGVEHIRRLKAEPAWGDKPVLIVTSSETDETLKESFEAGAFDLIRKPVNPVELRARVQNAIRLYEYSAELGQAQRQLSLAELSASVAHEVNNPLAAVANFLEILKEDLSPEALQASGKTIGRIEQGLLRIRGLVADLRLVGRLEDAGSSRFSLERPLSAALRLMAYKFSGEVRMLPYLESTAMVSGREGDVAQLLTVLMSLMIEVLQRSGGGSLVVGTQDVSGGVELTLSPLDGHGDSLLEQVSNSPWFAGLVRELRSQGVLGIVDKGVLSVLFPDDETFSKRSNDVDARPVLSAHR